MAESDGQHKSSDYENEDSPASDLFPKNTRSQYAFWALESFSLPEKKHLQGPKKLHNYDALKKSIIERKGNPGAYEVESTGIYKHALRLSGKTKFVGHDPQKYESDYFVTRLNMLVAGWVKLYEPLTSTVTLFKYGFKNKPNKYLPVLRLKGSTNEIVAVTDEKPFSFDFSQFKRGEWNFVAVYINGIYNYRACYVNGKKVGEQKSVDTPHWWAPDLTKNAAKSSEDSSNFGAPGIHYAWRRLTFLESTEEDDLAADMISLIQGTMLTSADDTVSKLYKLQKPSKPSPAPHPDTLPGLYADSQALGQTLAYVAKLSPVSSKASSTSITFHAHFWRAKETKQNPQKMHGDVAGVHGHVDSTKKKHVQWSLDVVAQKGLFLRLRNSKINMHLLSMSALLNHLSVMDAYTKIQACTSFTLHVTTDDNGKTIHVQGSMGDKSFKAKKTLNDNDGAPIHSFAATGNTFRLGAFRNDSYPLPIIVASVSLKGYFRCGYSPQNRIVPMPGVYGTLGKGSTVVKHVHSQQATLLHEWRSEYGHGSTLKVPSGVTMPIESVAGTGYSVADALHDHLEEGNIMDFMQKTPHSSKIGNTTQHWESVLPWFGITDLPPPTVDCPDKASQSSSSVSCSKVVSGCGSGDNSSGSSSVPFQLGRPVINANDIAPKKSDSPPPICLQSHMAARRYYDPVIVPHRKLGVDLADINTHDLREGNLTVERIVGTVLNTPVLSQKEAKIPRPSPNVPLAYAKSDQSLDQGILHFTYRGTASSLSVPYLFPFNSSSYGGTEIISTS